MQIPKKYFLFLLVLVAFDLVTKLGANLYLPLEKEVEIISGKLSLYLTYNRNSTGGQADYLLEGEYNKNFKILSNCFYVLVYLLYYCIVKNKNFKKIHKIIGFIILNIILSVFMGYIENKYSSMVISNWTVSVVSKLTGLLIYIFLFSIIQNKFIKVSFLLIIACGLGNLLSYFYPPYFVIDFIFIHGSYELLKIGVFNFADLFLDFGIIGLILSIIYFLVRRFKHKKSIKAEEDGFS